VLNTKRLNILVLGRGERYKERLNGIISFLKDTPHNIFIFTDNGGLNKGKIQGYSKIKHYEYCEKPKQKIPNNTGIPYFQAASNYILYYDYARQTGLKPLLFANQKNINDRGAAALKQINSFLIKHGTPDLILVETIERLEAYYWNGLAKQSLMLEIRIAGLGKTALVPASGTFRRNPLLDLYLKKSVRPKPKYFKIAKKILGNLKYLNHSYAM